MQRSPYKKQVESRNEQTKY